MSAPWWTEPQVDFFGLDSKDQYVYRYRSTEVAFIELRSRKLRMSSFTRMNDPKETADWKFDLWLGDHKLDESLRLEIEESGTKFAKDHAKLLCTTEDADAALERGVNKIWGRGFSRPRMWQQYADNHRGVCMIFDRAALHQAILASRPSQSRLIYGPVYYNNTPRTSYMRPTLNPFMLDYGRVLAVGLQQAVAEHTKQHFPTFFFEKALDWQSEKEYRWIIWDNELPQLEFDFGDALKGLVAGPAFDADQWEELQDLCAADKVLMTQIYWLNGSPEMKFRLPSSAARAKPEEV